MGRKSAKSESIQDWLDHVPDPFLACTNKQGHASPSTGAVPKSISSHNHHSKHSLPQLMDDQPKRVLRSIASNVRVNKEMAPPKLTKRSSKRPAQPEAESSSTKDIKRAKTIASQESDSTQEGPR